MLRNVSLVFKHGALQSGLRSVSTTNVRSKSSSGEATIPKSNNDYFKAMHDNQKLAGNTKPLGWDEALPFEQIAGPKPLPLIGNSWRSVLSRLKGEDLADMVKFYYENYGKFCLVRKMIGNEDYLMIFTSEHTEEFFRKEGVWPVRDTFKSLEHYRKVARKDLFGENTGLATEQGEKWFKFRTIVNPILMQPRVTVQYVSKMDLIAQEFIENMRKMALADPKRQMPEDFGNELNKWALESMVVIAIDKRLGCLSPNPSPETQQIINSVLEFFDLVYELDFGPPLWRIFPSPTLNRFVKQADFVSGHFKKHINESYERIKNSPVKKDVSEQSVLEKLLKINKDVAFNMAIDMMTGGIDTTSKASGAVLYYLAKNPKTQNTLREELVGLLPSKDSPITKDILEEATYLKAVIKEGLRLAPASIGNFRRIQKDVVIGGYRIPKGTQCLMGNLMMCKRDYPKPEEFIPERWLKTTKDEFSHKNVSAFASLPFGFGPRSCIGKRLANLEMETVVAKVVRNFKLEWHHPDMRFRQKLIYGIADPLRLTVKEAGD